MRVLLIGQKAFGAEVLRAFAKESIELVGAIVGTKELEQEDAVETVAREIGVDCFKTNSLRAEEVLEWARERRPDLIAMAFVTLYMPKSLVDVAPMGAINFHPSLLPLHRGISSLPWTILCGDKIAGLSVYFIDEGMDTGDVIVQKSVEIAPDDDFKTLYFKKIFPLGVQAMCEAVRLIAAGDPPRKKQDEALASYEPPLKREHLILRWEESAEQNLRKVHAGNPGIGAIASLNGREVRIYTAAISNLVADGVPGQVLSFEGGIHVKTGEGVLRIDTLCYAGDKKMSAADFCRREDPESSFIFADWQGK